MNKEHMAFLFGGLAFGILIGFGAYHAVQSRPELGPTAAGGGTAAAPRGPMAPTQVGPNAGGGAPMVAEINRLKGMLQDDPENGQILMRLANIYHDGAMWQQAVGYYERAIAVMPENPDVLTDLGVCYRGMNEHEKALGLFERAQEVNPKHWQSLYNIVVVAGFDLDRADEAFKAIDKMESMDQRPPEIDQSRLDNLRHAVEQAQVARETEGQS